MARMRKRLGTVLIPLFAALMALGLTAGIALAYEFASTNDANRANGNPHVNVVEIGQGSATLEFVSDDPFFQVCFEYRIDGEVLTSGSAHSVLPGEFFYPAVCLDNRPGNPGGEASPVVRTFTANQLVEVRLAIGGRSTWYFDWTPFVVSNDPTSKDQCKKGGWQDFGFANQGRCIQFVNTGKDSR